MTKFVQRGTMFQVTEDADMVVFNRLPVGTYSIGFDQMSGRFFLKMLDNFVLGKIYGDIPKRANRILDTYQSREFSTGALLTGEKGCGKTMLAKLISIEAAKRDIPTIIINTPFVGEPFNKFLQSIDQECVIIFDEYEKVYDRDAQTELLTLLDGVYPTHKLFVLTTNDRYGVSDYMLNRPGRLFYNLEYKGLPSSFVKEYCEDNLKNKDHIAGVVNLCDIFENLNFDMLKAVVEEMNRYNERASDAIEMMNIKPDSSHATFTAELEIDNEKVKPYRSNIEVNPLKQFTMDYYLTDAMKEKLKKKKAANDLSIDDDLDAGRFGSVDVTPDCIVKINKGNYHFKLPNGTLILKKRTYSESAMSDLAHMM